MINNVVSLKLGFVNFFLIKGPTNILVDTGNKVSHKKILTLFKAHAINPRDIDLIIISHAHEDHFGNVFYLKELCRAKVLCHSKAAPHLKNGTNCEIVPRTFEGKVAMLLMKWLNSNKPAYQGIEADITIDSQYDLGEYGINGKIIPTPGHCDCSLSIVLDSGEAIIGDMLMASIFFPQKLGLAFFATDEQLLIKSIQKIQSLKPKLYYAAHGGSFTAQQVDQFMKKYS